MVRSGPVGPSSCEPDRTRWATARIHFSRSPIADGLGPILRSIAGGGSTTMAAVANGPGARGGGAGGVNARRCHAAVKGFALTRDQVIEAGASGPLPEPCRRSLVLQSVNPLSHLASAVRIIGDGERRSVAAALTQACSNVLEEGRVPSPDRAAIAPQSRETRCRTWPPRGGGSSPCIPTRSTDRRPRARRRDRRSRLGRHARCGIGVVQIAVVEVARLRSRAGRRRPFAAWQYASLGRAR